MSLAPGLDGRYFRAMALSRLRILALLSATVSACVQAQAARVRPTSLHFQCKKRPSAGAASTAASMVYSADRGYGFRAPLGGTRTDACSSDSPFLFDVALPEGNNVTVVLGDAARPTTTTVKAESRRLMLEQVRTRVGKSVTQSFTVNVRTPYFAAGDFRAPQATRDRLRHVG